MCSNQTFKDNSDEGAGDWIQHRRRCRCLRARGICKSKQAGMGLNSLCAAASTGNKTDERSTADLLALGGSWDFHMGNNIMVSRQQSHLNGHKGSF